MKRQNRILKEELPKSEGVKYTPGEVQFSRSVMSDSLRPHEPQHEYSKVAGHKISTQKSLAFLYTNNEKTEREIKEAISFSIAM